MKSKLFILNLFSFLLLLLFCSCENKNPITSGGEDDDNLVDPLPGQISKVYYTNEFISSQEELLETWHWNDFNKLNSIYYNHTLATVLSNDEYYYNNSFNISQINTEYGVINYGKKVFEYEEDLLKRVKDYRWYRGEEPALDKQIDIILEGDKIKSLIVYIQDKESESLIENEKWEFIWEGENISIIKSDDLQTTYEFKYDDKNNPYYKKVFCHVNNHNEGVYEGFELFFSKNNITERRFYPNGSEDLNSIITTNEYIYNEDNYPIEKVRRESSKKEVFRYEYK